MGPKLGKKWVWGAKAGEDGPNPTCDPPSDLQTHFIRDAPTLQKMQPAKNARPKIAPSALKITTCTVLFSVWSWPKNPRFCVWLCFAQGRGVSDLRTFTKPVFHPT